MTHLFDYTTQRVACFVGPIKKTCHIYISISLCILYYFSTFWIDPSTIRHTHNVVGEPGRGASDFRIIGMCLRKTFKLSCKSFKTHSHTGFVLHFPFHILFPKSSNIEKKNAICCRMTDNSVALCTVLGSWWSSYISGWRQSAKFKRNSIKLLREECIKVPKMKPCEVKCGNPSQYEPNRAGTGGVEAVTFHERWSQSYKRICEQGDIDKKTGKRKSKGFKCLIIIWEQ